jgi:hypothetical protein
LYAVNGYRKGFLECSSDYIGEVGRPRVEIRNQTIFFSFIRTDGFYEKWFAPFTSLESSIKMGFIVRDFNPKSSLKFVTLENEKGKNLTVMDFSEFIVSSPFNNFSQALYRNSENDYDFIHEVWHFVAQMTVYSLENKETPKYPLETLFSGGGDCEDLAILFASIIKSADLGWKISFIYMDRKNPTDPQTVNHLVVLIETGNEKYIIETTNKNNMTPYEEVVGWHLEI